MSQKKTNYENINMFSYNPEKSVTQISEYSNNEKTYLLFSGNFENNNKYCISILNGKNGLGILEKNIYTNDYMKFYNLVSDLDRKEKCNEQEDEL